MGGLSIWHWLVVVLFLVAYVLPMGLVLRRIGYSGWISLLILIPGLNVAFYWWLALAKWPREAAEFDPFAKEMR